MRATLWRSRSLPPSECRRAGAERGDAWCRCGRSSLAGGAKAARLTLVDGLAGAVVSVGGAHGGLRLHHARRAHSGIELVSDPDPGRVEPEQCGKELQQLYP